MPNEPERDIEKRLKAYAEKRRQDAGEPLELHPATRRMLQGEVSRRKAKPADSESWLARAFALLRPRFAVGACVLAGLAIAAAMLLPVMNRAKHKGAFAQQDQLSVPQAQPMELAKVKTRAPASGSAEPVVAGGKAGEDVAGILTDEAATKTEPNGVKQPATAEKLAADRLATLDHAQGREAERRERVVTSVAGLAETKAGTEGSPQALAACPPQLVPSESAARGTTDQSDKSGKPGMAMGLPAVTAAPASPASPASVTAARWEEPLPAGGVGGVVQPVPVITQNFAQVELPAARRAVANQPPAQNILNSFRVEQSGERIQIVDNDGSTYAGYARLVGDSRQPDQGVAAGLVADAAVVRKESLAKTESGTRKAPAGRQITALPAKDIQASEGQNYNFRVSGMNNAAKQQVVFTGNMFVPTNVVVAPADQVADNKGVQFLESPPRQEQLRKLQNQVQNARIAGTAIIGDKQKINIDAVSVPTP